MERRNEGDVKRKVILITPVISERFGNRETHNSFRIGEQASLCKITLKSCSGVSQLQSIARDTGLPALADIEHLRKYFAHHEPVFMHL